MDSCVIERPKHATNNSPNDFLCGWCAGCVETCILFPLSKLTFRQQLYGVRLNDAVSQISTEGVQFFYRGLLPPLIQRTSTRMVMFGMFDTYRQLLGCQKGTTFTYCFAVSGLLAGTTEALLCPLERVQVLLQTSAFHTEFRNTGEAVRFVRPYGIPEFYRGFSLVVIRNSLSNVLFFTLRDPLKQFLIESFYTTSKKKMSTSVEVSQSEKIISKLLFHASNFVSGSVLGAGISTLFFPLNVVKHRMQSVIGTEFSSAPKVFRMVWKERNYSIRELFRGVHLNYTRSLLTWGITNSVYEYLKTVLKTI